MKQRLGAMCVGLLLLAGIGLVGCSAKLTCGTYEFMGAAKELCTTRQYCPDQIDRAGFVWTLRANTCFNRG